jgi:putative transposase
MDGLFRRRHLPHWDVDGGTYFVTVCLQGSVPAAGLRELRQYRSELDARPRPASVGEAEWERRKDKLVFARLDEMLDTRPAVRHLQDPDLASVVRDALYHFAEARYRLISYVVMPSHLHWVFHPMPNWCETLPPGRTAREVIMHGLKSYTARECNRLLGQTGPFWQQESYDHWVRDDDELARIIEYIALNPVRAGLVTSAADYVFSSAHDAAR